MNTQTMVKTLEKHFVELDKKAKPKTLAEAVSNNLIPIMPRISSELFEFRREATIKLTEEQRVHIDNWYVRFRRLRSDWKDVFYPIRVCKGTLSLFQYATVPDIRNVVCGNAKITYEDGPKVFNTENSLHNLAIVNCNNKGNSRSYHQWFWNNKEFGNAEVTIKSVWTAPFTLDICTQVPQVPESITELSDLAMFHYFKEATTRVMKGDKSSLLKPKLGVLWAPTDKVLYCTGKVPIPNDYPPVDRKSDPALILEIPDGDKIYRHVIATWDMENERPFKNWLAEYSE